MRDIKNRARIKTIINESNIPQALKDQCITYLYEEENSIPIKAILYGLDRYNVEYTAEDIDFLKEMYARYS